jgi:hypothetical protein
MRMYYNTGFWGNVIDPGTDHPLFYHWDDVIVKENPSLATAGTSLVPMLQGNEYSKNDSSSLSKVDKLKKKFAEYDSKVFSEPDMVKKRHARQLNPEEDREELVIYGDQVEEVIKSRSDSNLSAPAVTSNLRSSLSNNNSKSQSIISETSMAVTEVVGGNFRRATLDQVSDDDPERLDKLSSSSNNIYSSSLQNSYFISKVNRASVNTDSNPKAPIIPRNKSTTSLSTMNLSVRKSVKAPGLYEDKKKLVLKLPPVANPFKRLSEAYVQKTSHNRRRWSHIFTEGKVRSGYDSEPNWRSLCEPAILPITTDHYPTNLKQNQDFSEKQYNVLLVGSKDTTESHLALIREMVSQRLAQDFQLVTPDASKYTSRSFDNVTSFCLSMGHRVHFLVRIILSFLYNMYYAAILYNTALCYLNFICLLKFL